MRVGKNPNRFLKLGEMPELVIAVVTHLPDVEQDYHKERLEIVQISLNSLRKHAGVNAPILIWDNSGTELRDWLVNEYKPDYLILSDNVGKANAQASIFRMFPPDTLIAYADDDMLYMPNWLSKQLALMDKFPPSIMTGYPTNSAMRNNNHNTIEWAEKNAEVKRDKLIPDQWNIDFMVSVGQKNPPKYPFDDILIVYNDAEAYATSHHCQFIARAKDVLPFKDFIAKATPPESDFDRGIDEAGILRLATTERLTMHMGNVLDDELLKTIDHYGLRNA